MSTASRYCGRAGGTCGGVVTRHPSPGATGGPRGHYDLRAEWQYLQAPRGGVRRAPTLSDKRRAAAQAGAGPRPERGPRAAFRPGVRANQGPLRPSFQLDCAAPGSGMPFLPHDLGCPAARAAGARREAFFPTHTRPRTHDASSRLDRARGTACALPAERTAAAATAAAGPKAASCPASAATKPRRSSATNLARQAGVDGSGSAAPQPGAARPGA